MVPIPKRYRKEIRLLSQIIQSRISIFLASLYLGLDLKATNKIPISKTSFRQLTLKPSFLMNVGFGVNVCADNLIELPGFFSRLLMSKLRPASIEVSFESQ